MFLVIEKYLMIIIVALLVVFIGYYIYKTVKSMIGSSSADKFLNSLKDDDEDLYRQIAMDFRDDKLIYIFDEFNDVVSKAIEIDKMLAITVEGKIDDEEFKVIFKEEGIEIEIKGTSKDITYREFTKKEEVYTYIFSYLKSL